MTGLPRSYDAPEIRRYGYQRRQDAIFASEAMAILQRGKRCIKIKFFSHGSFLFFSLQK